MPGVVLKQLIENTLELLRGKPEAEPGKQSAGARTSRYFGRAACFRARTLLLWQLETNTIQFNKPCEKPMTKSFKTLGVRWLCGLLITVAGPVLADEVGCVTTAWKLIGANHKVCVDAFEDPKIPNVVCHISQARTGGISGAVGLAEDPSQFSLACRQVGPINLPAKLPADETVFSENTSIFFKSTNITRLWDAKHNTLVYLAISRKVIEGAPANSISTVPVMPWGK